MDIMDIDAILSSLKSLLGILKILKISTVKYYCKYFFSKPHNVVVFGASGSGKTELVKSLVYKELSSAEPNRTNYYDKHILVLDDGSKIHFF